LKLCACGAPVLRTVNTVKCRECWNEYRRNRKDPKDAARARARTRALSLTAKKHRETFVVYLDEEYRREGLR
jgi:hypothetical protein